MRQKILQFLDSLRHKTDMRLVLYRGVKRFLIIFAIGLFLKFFVCDSVRVDGSQMEPAILSGDRVLLMKAPYVTPMLRHLFTSENKITVAVPPGKGKSTVLRIAAIFGDTVGIDAGQFYRNRYPVKNFHKDTLRHSVIPAEYSPADFMAPYRVPAPKDSISFADQTLRDLIFAYSVLRQEKSGTRLKAFAVVGDSVISDYRIKHFSLYSGPIDSIPDELSNDWFFWSRLQEYLKRVHAEEADGKPAPQLAISVFKGGKEITGFRVKGRYLFLMGDNWSEALDSRYFGPVSSKYVKGRPVITLWGAKRETGGKRIFVFLK